MIDLLLTTHTPLLERLAASWLHDGASQFSLRVEGKVLFRRPAQNGQGRPELRAPLAVDGRAAGELLVRGVTSPGAQERLQADAVLLSALTASETHLDRMTAELVHTRDQLLALYEMTRASRLKLSLEQLLTSLITQIHHLLQTERAFVVLKSPAQATLLYQYPTASISRDTLDYYLQMVQQEARPLVLHSHHPKTGSASWRSMLLLPIMVEEQVLGGIGLIDKKGGAFTASDLKLGSAIAEQTALQVEKQLLYQKQIAQTRLETEMELAHHVHARLLPERLPEVPGLQIAAGCRTASQVGGDFYDFICHGDDLTMIVGDISGKGMAAAMLMTMTRAVLRSQQKTEPLPTPQEVIDRANKSLYADFSDVNMFATVFVAHYSATDRLLTYANAGHSPVIYCPAGGQARLLEADGMPIGILPHSISADQKLTLAPGDVLVAATDGFSEAEDEAQHRFGYERFLEVVHELAANPHNTARSLVNQLYALVAEHSGRHPQSDDQTVVILKASEEEPPR